MTKREELIAIATRLFSDKGYENTPISEVCEAAQVSKGLIAHHFKSKDGLLREVFMSTTDLIAGINKSLDPDVPANVRLLEILESFFRQLEHDKMLFQFNLNMIVQPGTREILSDLISERSSMILNSTRSLFEEIDRENSRALSYIFIAELDGIALNYLIAFDDYPFEMVKEKIITKYKSISRRH